MLFIIDSYGHATAGHFWPASNNLIFAFHTLKQDVCFINPTASKCIQEQENLKRKIAFNSISNSKIYPKEILYISDKKFLEEASILINTWCDKEKKKGQVIFSWLPQFNEKDLSDFIISIKHNLNSLAAITNFTPKYVLGSQPDEILTHQNFFDKIKLEKKTLWIWTEQSISHRNKSIRKLPEFHTTAINQIETSQRRGIGFYGILSPFRGIGEFFIISFFNQKISFEARGAGFHWSRSWRPFKFRIMRYRKFYLNPFAYLINFFISSIVSLLRFSRNLQITYFPFPTEDELEEAISSKEAIFFASKLPFSSGIVLTALASGTPVIWLGSSGSLVELLEQKIPQGRLRYWELFVPNRLQKKLTEVKKVRVEAVYTFSEYRDELNSVL